MQTSFIIKSLNTIVIAILSLISLSSCVQKQKGYDLANESTTKVIAVDGATPFQFSQQKFDSILQRITTEPFPVVDTTNYNHSKPLNLFSKEEIATLNLEHIYPDFFKSTHNFKAQPAYKIDFSNDFHTVVFTLFKGEHELESLLITYDLNGNIIDYIVIAYDEIAEGWSKKVATITKNYLRIDTIFWDEIEEVTQAIYTINNVGKIEEVDSTNLPESIENYVLINNILRDLKLEWAQIEIGYLTFGELSQVTTQTLVIIPEIAMEEDDLLRLNTYTVLLNARSGAITHQLYESYEENGWQSDAIAIEAIEIDPLVYRISESEKAFGIVVKYKNNSQPNPYREEVISLYTKEKNTLKKILDHYPIYESSGIVNVNNCYAEYTKTRNTISFDTTQTNGYYNILVENSLSKELFKEDKNGECTPTETLLSNQTKVLTYNGNVYEEATSTHQEGNHQKTEKVTQYLEYYPRKLQNLQLPKFTVEQAFLVNNVKVVSGYYNPIAGQLPPQDTEKDWGDRLLQLDQDNKILYQSKGIGDVYLYEPHFYKNDASDKVIIIVQKWFEYPFGGEVFILENKTIKYIGTLDIEGYNPEQDDNQVLTKIVEIKENTNLMEFTFKSDQLILNPGTDDIIIKNNHLKYIYNNHTLYLKK
ncbi:MAG: hypothetical protein R2781_09440 [Flavobacteriaceae bacterium]